MYTDYANIDEDAYVASKGSLSKMKGGVTTAFPQKLHKILKQGLHADIISWAPHGRCFLIHKPKLFVQIVLSKYFHTTKKTSFTRQLNLYGFVRLQSSGNDQGGYYHEKFLRGKSELCKLIKRIPLKGTTSKHSLRADSEQEEPEFYHMSYLPDINPHQEASCCDKNNSSSASSACPSSLRRRSSSKKTSEEISPKLYFFVEDPTSSVPMTGFDFETRRSSSKKTNEIYIFVEDSASSVPLAGFDFETRCFISQCF